MGLGLSLTPTTLIQKFGLGIVFAQKNYTPYFLPFFFQNVNKIILLPKNASKIAGYMANSIDLD